ncbi:DUF924 domain-containing protein [Pelagibius litoralis]|uniref:DUF924 domain-containing protein n=1 Tax=Pelagibius litoralis TaxID=374515 RepID=A0A967C787_9PROT|nr:DUF924 family protein [Pelagibius litoralis]NIA68891.1 DUF924 domain-containing protein [Pelagibius litoralis]
MMDAQAVLGFWFAEGRDKQWFGGGEAFDQEVREALLAAYDVALTGGYEAWRESPQGCLALCILLDQVPRNIFRGTPKAFASDATALALTRHALDRGFDSQLSQVERLFLYLPLEHSEDLGDQERCLRLTADLTDNPEWLTYAEAHRSVIARFGRFPHRNAILGRENSAEEEAFLAEPNSSF